MTIPSPRILLDARILGTAVLLMAIAVFLSARPETQVLKHQRRLLRAMEKRDRDAVLAVLSTEYRDRWGFDREALARESSEILRHFVALAIVAEDPVASGAGDRWTVQTRMRVTGRGSPIAEIVLSEASRLREPWTFRWRKEGGPWTWRLVSADQPELFIPENRGW